ncbi:MAG: NADH-quinone oxidoreductase subunit C [Armatimonadetes bacterium]|nr:NADH-quinone oxidoreductase subunit C [Armatimonadota bacterium]
MSQTAVDRPDVKALQAKFGGKVLKVKESCGDTFVCVARESIREVADFLKNDPAMQFTYFGECLGADYSKWDHERDLSERFEVIYNLYSLHLGLRLFLKVGVDDGQKVPSLVPVYLGAEYPEREVWDLYGVVFEGNEQKQRFLLPDDWVGFPLRKEYPLGGEDVLFDQGDRGPAIEDLQMPHAGESWEGKAGTEDVGGR